MVVIDLDEKEEKRCAAVMTEDDATNGDADGEDEKAA